MTVGKKTGRSASKASRKSAAEKSATPSTRKGAAKRTAAKKTAKKAAGSTATSRATPAGKRAASKKASRPAAGRTAANKSAAKKAPAKKTGAKRTAAKKAPAKKAVAKKAVAKKTGAKRTAAKKAPAKKAVAKKAGAKRAVAKAATTSQLDPARKWSLGELEGLLPAIEPGAILEVRDGLIGAYSLEALLALGTSFRTDDILAMAPPFTVGTLNTLRQLGAPPPGFALELVPLFVNEVKELERLYSAFEQGTRDLSMNITERRDALKLANTRALRARRGVVRTLLRGVIPVSSAQRSRLKRAGARALTPAATVASVRSVATVLAELRESESTSRLLDRYKYGEAHVGHLRSLADDVEQLASLGPALLPPLVTSQHALDRQDGIVCAIIRAIWWPLRDALDDGAKIQMPPLGALERLVMRTSDGGSDEGDDTDDAGTGDAGTDEPTPSEPGVNEPAPEG